MGIEPAGLSSLRWTPLDATDAGTVAAIAGRVHPTLPERTEVLDEKRRLFPAGCRKLKGPEGVVLGYALSHPWTLAAPPALDTFLGRLPPTANCLFVHDVAVLPEARGHGAGPAFLALATEVARRYGLPTIALVAAYGTERLWGRHGFAPIEGEPPPCLAEYGEHARYMVRRR